MSQPHYKQPGYLSLTGLAVGYALWSGAGYLVAGWLGAGCGAALLTVLYARPLWFAIQAIPVEAEDAKPEGPPDQGGS